MSASSTSQILMPVAGLKVGNVLPLVDGSHLLSIKICSRQTSKQTNKWINAYVHAHSRGAKSLAAVHLGSSYLSVSDIWDFHRQRKRMSLDLLNNPIRCCSILGHFLSAVQSRSASSACSAHRLAFYNNVEFLPPHITVKENSTPPLSTVKLPISYFLHRNFSVHKIFTNYV